MIAQAGKLIKALTSRHANAIESYFTRNGFALIKAGRPGKHEADYFARDRNGLRYPVEEKRWAETCISTSAWWSYWRPKLDLDTNEIGNMPAPQRGWIAVVAGQLREWCQKGDVEKGYLAVEFPLLPLGIRNPRTSAAHLETALEYLETSGILGAWKADFSMDYSFYKITYSG